MKKIIVVAFAALALVAPQAVFAEEAPTLISTAVFPDITLKSASNSAIAGAVADDAGGAERFPACGLLRRRGGLPMPM